MEQTKISQKPIIRMSQSGRCPKALSAELLGYEPEPTPEFVERAANEGKWHEDRIVTELEQEGYFIFDRQLEVSLEFPSFTLIGHIDGKANSMLEGASLNLDKDVDTRLLEIKSMSQFEFDRWMKEGFRGFSNYASQITCYMEATGLKECLYIVKNRSSGYEDRRVLTRKNLYISPVIERLTEVVTYATDNKLVPREPDLNSIECRRCNYKHLCVPEAKELTPIEEAGLNAATADWRTGKQLVAEGQELVDKAREVLESHTKATNILKWQHSGLTINLIKVHRESYEKKQLLEMFTPEQLLPALKVSDYDQLRIDDLAKEE